MKGCRPLDKKEWTLVFHSVRGPNRLRTKALMILGRKTGFRVSELLSLRVRDLIHDGQVRQAVTVERQSMKGGKAGKASGRTVPLHPDVVKHVLAHYEDLKGRGYWRPDDFFFQSRAKGNKPIDRVQAWRDCVEPVKRRGVEGKVGTHGLMRKTFAKDKLDYLTANWVPGKEVPFHVLQRCTGHKDQKSLMAYIEFADEDVHDAFMNS
ncbi:tyrosine-type recombinase/integrase [Pseudodesulfovibrio sp. JC047]|uniref:tyrosine-type recombinase/integrase n=1 Tax=Pseudodesulfovibrio sp. JC047 TaxID=2683199 RepID=UPI0013D7AC3D|nr:tyrosine-type recombinase/integrase [Pseudodesulfovibrio sp. JC047]NDV20841.1 tyrosine-type recombinase/integrase [Pseudodesulfovibrio sp. JC047]